MRVSVISMSVDLFDPLRWRWKSEHQVKVRTKMHKKDGTIDVTIEGLDSQNEAVYVKNLSLSKIDYAHVLLFEIQIQVCLRKMMKFLIIQKEHVSEILQRMI